MDEGPCWPWRADSPALPRTERTSRTSQPSAPTRCAHRWDLTRVNFEDRGRTRAVAAVRVRLQVVHQPSLDSGRVWDGGYRHCEVPFNVPLQCVLRESATVDTLSSVRWILRTHRHLHESRKHYRQQHRGGIKDFRHELSAPNHEWADVCFRCVDYAKTANAWRPRFSILAARSRRACGSSRSLIPNGARRPRPVPRNRRFLRGAGLGARDDFEEHLWVSCIH
jgi:hypothetical protein